MCTRQIIYSACCEACDYKAVADDKRYKNGTEQAGRCRDLPISYRVAFFLPLLQILLYHWGLWESLLFSVPGTGPLEFCISTLPATPPVVLAWIKVSATCGESGILIGEGGDPPGI